MKIALLFNHIHRGAENFLSDTLDTLEDFIPAVEKARDYFNRKSLIILKEVVGDEYQMCKMYAPKGFDKGDWEKLIYSKMDEDYTLNDISTVNADLILWFHDDFEGKYTIEESLKIMQENSIPITFRLDKLNFTV